MSSTKHGFSSVGPCVLTLGQQPEHPAANRKNYSLGAGGGTRIASKQPGMKHAPNDKGFTFIEMLVTASVLVVATAIAVPSAVRLLAQYELSSAANDVAFEISRAKMQAVAQNNFVRLVVSGGTVLRRQTATSSTGSWTNVTSFVKLPRSASASGTGPTFNRNGLASSDGSIVVRNGAGAKTVEYNILGRVTISTGGDQT
jgi:prepilin-type N-terminal cleavage/methylation domain-containing protein